LKINTHVSRDLQYKHTHSCHVTLKINTHTCHVTWNINTHRCHVTFKDKHTHMSRDLEDNVFRDLEDKHTHVSRDLEHKHTRVL